MPTCYSAVRHSIHGPKPVLTVRLACVRRAASVHPEPGSNSPFKCQPVNRLRFDSRVRPVAPIAVSLLGLTDSRGKESRSVHVTHSRQPSSRSACLSGPRLFDRGIRFSRFALVAAVAVCGGARREEVIYAACGGVARARAPSTDPPQARVSPAGSGPGRRRPRPSHRPASPGPGPGHREGPTAPGPVTKKGPPAGGPARRPGIDPEKGSRRGVDMTPRATSTRKCPSLVSDVLLSHGLTPQYHRRWGA